MSFEPDENYQRITLRIPRGLHTKLTAAARERSHSMNAEIVARLEQTFQFQGEMKGALARMEEIIGEIKRMRPEENPGDPAAATVEGRFTRSD